MVIRRDTTLDSVLTEDVTHLMTELGIITEFETGRFPCEICDDVMNYHNFKIIFAKKEHEFGFVCNKPTCLTEFALRD